MMSSNEIYSIREWAPLNMNERVPPTTQRGLFSIDIIFTCIDAISDHLAVGTSVGIVFWYNRNGEMQKLRAEVASRITCVKIVDSVEYMVAAGCANGHVSIFRIQKPLPPDLNLVAPCARLKPIERYTVKDLHHTPVTCVEWSKNGMKLYSGDRQGIVVLTELDYQAHQIKSCEILSEAYEIVQLSVHQCFLLVSTLYRAVVCQRNINSGLWQITQIGKKDRKQLVDCGGIFINRDLKRPLLVLGRPGLRFWFADTEGNVQKTLIFRDAILHGSSWEIPILNPKFGGPLIHNVPSMPNTNESQNFRTFQRYVAEDALIVTHDESTLYLLNIDCLRVESVARGFRKILDFCVCGKEIFVLEGDRSIIRLAPRPEKPNKSAQIIFNPSLPPPEPLLNAAAAGLFETPVEYEPGEHRVTNGQECFELPPIETLNLNIPIALAVESPRGEQSRRLQIFNEISQMEFDESILHRSGLLINGRKKRKSKSSDRRENTGTGIVEIGQMVKTNDDNEPIDEAQASVPATSMISTAEQTTYPIFMQASFCSAPALNESQSNNKINNLTLPLCKNDENVLSQAHVSPISPIAAEEFERAQSLAETTTMMTQTGVFYPGQTNEMKAPNLKFDYPLKTMLPNQRHRNVGNYIHGQPVDEIRHILLETALIEEDPKENVAANQCTESIPNNLQQQQEQQQQQLQFVTTQPVPGDVNSFLPDFRRIRDPMRRSPPQSGDSATSSEWEFLDN